MNHHNKQHSFTDCLSCLLDTECMINNDISEILSEGNKLRYQTYKSETMELKSNLQKFNPQTILDVWSGAGRIIQTCAVELPEANIYWVELDDKHNEFLKNRFQINLNVKIIHEDINNFLSKTDQKFDMILCMMNTISCFDEPTEIVQKLLQHWKYAVFTTCNEKYNLERMLMYQARGHKKITFDGKQYCLDDERSPWLKSRGRSEEELYEMVEKAWWKIIEFKELWILFYVILKS